MGWESRSTSKDTYYTQSVRENGKVKRIYLGKGERAQNAAARDMEARLKKLAEREASDMMRIKQEGVDRAMQEYDRAVDRALCATLTELGYHRVRGEWSKKRK